KKAGASAAVLDFGLTAGVTGANRNIARLVVGDRPMLMLDDDVVPTYVARPRHPRGGVTLGHHADPCSYTFFTSRQHAVKECPSVAGDIYGAHASILGRGMADLLNS